MITAIKQQFAKDLPGIKEMLKGMATGNYVRRDLSLIATMFMAGSAASAGGAVRHGDLIASYGPVMAAMALLSLAMGWHEASKAANPADASRRAPRPWIAGLRSAFVSLTASAFGAIVSIGLSVAAGPGPMASLIAPFALLLAISAAYLITIQDKAWQKTEG